METEDSAALARLTAALTTYLRHCFGPAIAATVQGRLSDGWESDVYRFVAQGLSEGNEAFVLRLYFGAQADVKALTEARAMKLLAAAGYPVPSVLLAEPSAQPLGRPFLVMRHIEGEPLGRAIMQGDMGAFERFCSLLTQLHALPWPTLAGHEQLPRLSLAGQIDTLSAYRLRFPSATFDRALTWLQARVGDVSARPLSLIHFDFHPQNILVDAQGAPWVIDWTQCQITDPRFDLAWTLVLSGSQQSWAAAEAVRERYALAARAVGLGDGDAALWFFEAFACARRLLSVLIALDHGAAALGMRPGAEAIMARHLGPLAAVYARWLALTGVALPEAEVRLAAQG